LDMPSGKVITPLRFAGSMSVGAKHWVSTPHTSIYQDQDKQPLITLDIDELRSTCTQFISKGSHVAWGNRDGTVTMCDLEVIWRRLAQTNLWW
jgi:hypothetical protein